MFNSKAIQITNNETFFLMLFPFVIFVSFYFLRKKLANLALSNEKTISWISGIILVISGAFPYFDESIRGTVQFSFASIFENLNIYLSVFLGSLFILKKYSFVKIFVPIAIVLGLAPIINNPNNSLNTQHIINDIILSTLPFLSLFLSKKNLTTKGLFTSLFLIFFVLVTIFASKNLLINSFNFSKEINGKFYGVFRFETLQVILFILATMFLQIIIFTIIRYLFSEEKKNFFNKMLCEISIDKKSFLNQINEIEFVDINTLEYILFENDFVVLESISEPEIVVLKPINKPKEEIILPITLIMNRNSKGTRAPSL